MKYDYFYGELPGTYTFYQFPKAFYRDADLRELSSDAKILYGIMLDRLSLSAINNWRDEDGRVYIYMTLDNVEELMGCAKQKAVSLIKQLNDAGLIEKRRQGVHKPTKIYVKKLCMP